MSSSESPFQLKTSSRNIPWTRLRHLNVHDLFMKGDSDTILKHWLPTVLYGKHQTSPEMDPTLTTVTKGFTCMQASNQYLHHKTTLLQHACSDYQEQHAELMKRQHDTEHFSQLQVKMRNIMMK